MEQPEIDRPTSQIETNAAPADPVRFTAMSTAAAALLIEVRIAADTASANSFANYSDAPLYMAEGAPTNASHGHRNEAHGSGSFDPGESVFASMDTE